MNPKATFTHNGIQVTYKLGLADGNRELFVARLVFDGVMSPWQLVKTVKGYYFLRNLETYATTTPFTQNEIKTNIIGRLPVKEQKLSMKDKFRVVTYRQRTQKEIWEMGYSAGCSKMPDPKYADDAVYQAAYKDGLAIRDRFFQAYTQDAMPGNFEGAIAFQ